VIAEFTEVESGKRCDRPQLAAALAHCRLTHATLVIAKLDRLARNLAFVANLMESKVPFVACDNPHATPFTIHILAAVAEHEGKVISERIRLALAVRKARGQLIGAQLPECRNLDTEGRKLGSERSALVNRAARLDFDRRILPTVLKLRSEGRTLREIAAALNSSGIKSRHGALWTPGPLSRLLARAGESAL
jgi:DNA invertase Pin-like site-specific DNA recombinase